MAHLASKAPPLRTTHTILAPEEVAETVARHFAIGPIAECYLLRRAFNEAYLVQTEGGARYVARLSAMRTRGPANIAYEAALLNHVAARGASVAPAVMTKDEEPCVTMPLPEGDRPLALFQFVDGELPEELPDLALTGAALARLHTAAEGYAGPSSLYTLDLYQLLQRRLGWLLEAPTLDDALREQFKALAADVQFAVESRPALTRVVCHGDCHGGNNHVRTHDQGERTTAFFDFDDAGPGYLAYDLAVFLWSQLLRRGAPAPDAQAQERWQHFLNGYASQRPVAPHDLAAVPLFVAIRHVWLLGEYASRRHHWGSQVLPPAWLRKQVNLMRAWMALDLSALST